MLFPARTNQFGGSAVRPKGLGSRGSGAFGCTAYHAGNSTRELFDTGACASFVGPSLVKSLKLDTSPGTLSIHSAGGQNIKALRFVARFSVVMKCSKYFAKLWEVKIPNNIDIILGCDWLHANGVMIDMAERSAHFKSRVNRIDKEIHNHTDDSLPNVSLQLTSQRMLDSTEPNISTIGDSREISRNHPQCFTKSERSRPNINPTKALQILQRH